MIRFYVFTLRVLCSQILTYTKQGVNLNIRRFIMRIITMSIGNTLKERRIQLNIKQDDIAEQMKVAVQTVSKWERDHTEPKASQVCQLSKILKISEKEICRGTVLNEKSEPFDFVRKVSILMQEVPQTELLVGMQEFIEDEEGFLKMLAKVSDYPFQLFEIEAKEEAATMARIVKKSVMEQMKFTSDEEYENYTKELLETHKKEQMKINK
jgi:transcriptional regulator with XRE-family HTH domain